MTEIHGIKIEDLEPEPSLTLTFLQEHCTLGVGRRTMANELFGEYARFCAIRDVDMASRQRLVREIRAIVPAVKRRRGTKGFFYEFISVKK